MQPVLSNSCPCVLFSVGLKKEVKRAGGLTNQNYTPSVVMGASQRMRLIIRPNVLIGGMGRWLKGRYRLVEGRREVQSGGSTVTLMKS